jgi:hypothetical protein
MSRIRRKVREAMKNDVSSSPAKNVIDEEAVRDLINGARTKNVQKIEKYLNVSPNHSSDTPVEGVDYVLDDQGKPRKRRGVTPKPKLTTEEQVKALLGPSAEYVEWRSNDKFVVMARTEQRAFVGGFVEVRVCRPTLTGAQKALIRFLTEKQVDED